MCLLYISTVQKHKLSTQEKNLTTKNGKIPVYNSIKEGMEAGHKFNTVVIYLPPSGVKDGLAEAVRDNPDLKKAIILTLFHSPKGLVALVKFGYRL